MNKRLFSNFRIFLFLSLVGIFGQVSASSITDFLLKVVGTYEGETTWDGGKSPITTTIVQQGNSVGGTWAYPGEPHFPITFIKALPEKRELIIGWKQDQSYGQASFLFSPDYSSFEGTWGYGSDYEGAGAWDGISEKKQLASITDLISNERASEQIMVIIASLEPNLPQKVDSMTTLVAVELFGVRGMEYKYVLGTTKDKILNSTGLDLSALKASVRVGTVKSYCEQELMYWFRDNFVELKWAYVDVNNQELFALRVNPNDC